MPLPSGLPEFPVNTASGHTPVIYLHGFASSPDSTKARFFGERFSAHGVPKGTAAVAGHALKVHHAKGFKIRVRQQFMQ